ERCDFVAVAEAVVGLILLDVEVRTDDRVLRCELRRQFSFQPSFLVDKRVGLVRLAKERLLRVALAITAGPEEPQAIAQHAPAEGSFIDIEKLAVRTRLAERRLRRPLRIGE